MALPSPEVIAFVAVERRGKNRHSRLATIAHRPRYAVAQSAWNRLLEQWRRHSPRV